MTNATPVDWVLVADRSRACLFHALPDGLRPWPTVASFVHEQGRLSDRDLQSDAPGRLARFGGASSGVESQEDRAHVEARRFATQLVDYLDHARHSRRFDRLVLVAPPKFLGVLREASPAPLRALTALEVNQDLMALTEAELQQRLPTIVSSLPA